MKLKAFSLFSLVAAVAGQTVLHPISGTTNKCLEVRGDVQANGTPVQIFDCNGTPAQQWDITEGLTTVRLANSPYCLDAGSNGTLMKIWECFDGLAAQQWFLTNDSRIALNNQGFCLDLPNGNLTNTVQVQIWKCTDGDVNQIWTS
ncbi:hypothetical protein NP233_g4292 [Leucocoprinus birnbaumii]|uniref:Ricin B lectin domain-containing protein n=1 Tax=Leucocoprinus birnbaumii TaxID=56174 RepID=A0AAD5W1K3_9AGAR|nr:hypothetical protein NP233_g4292 [Leucocoprinus birnbaumii]